MLTLKLSDRYTDVHDTVLLKILNNKKPKQVTQ